MSAWGSSWGDAWGAEAPATQEIAAPVGHPVYVKRKKSSIEELRELIEELGIKAAPVPPAEPGTVATIAAAPVVQRAAAVTQLPQLQKRLERVQAQLREAELQFIMDDEEELLMLLAA